MRAPLPLFLFLSLFFQAGNLLGQALNLRAPNAAFDFVDQGNGVGNSCGPACLLNAYGSGLEPYRDCYTKLPGTSDRARIASVIKSWGQRPSQNIPGRQRWELRGGVNFQDLTLMAAEMSELNWSARKPRGELFFAASGKDSQKMLFTAHQRLAKSLKKGLPPILSVRRFVHRRGQWQSVHGHFVVLTAMPEKLPRGSVAFPIQFCDPQGAKQLSATVTISQNKESLPCLTLLSLASKIGSSQVRGGETSALGLAGAIGVW